MKAVILAAGKGSRLGKFTDNIPKPMIKLNNKPILEHNILMCQKAGIKDIFINTHYLPEKIKNYFGSGSKYGVKICYNYEPEILGTAGGILFFFDKLKDDPFYVIYGDNYTEFNLTDLKTYHDSVKSEFTIALHKVNDIRQCGLVYLKKDGRIDKFLEKPEIDYIKSGWVNAGIYFIDPKTIGGMLKQNTDFAYDIIPLALLKKRRLFGYKLRNNLWSIDTPELYTRTKSKLKNNIKGTLNKC